MPMYQHGKQELHLSQKVSIRTEKFGKIEVSVLTIEFSKIHGTYKYGTQILTPNDLNQILKVGSVQQYYTEEEAKRGHQEIIRKLREKEFQVIPEVFKMVFT